MPGPPPPYPQGPRGAPPGAMHSPNPTSPATSLPMSSPAGMMHSPRPMGSSPGTPVSGAPLTSPVPGSKNSPGSNPSNQGPNAQSGMNKLFKVDCFQCSCIVFYVISSPHISFQMSCLAARCKTFPTKDRSLPSKKPTLCLCPRRSKFSFSILSRGKS
jgi:hypothetical protein